ncbi:chemotaxis-specific protein-glutamate methyltransferase CheB [Erythrobacter sp. KY5]|uniref:chemotaxis-specific protein-glutamate methyltransferase CheB n=1 Tax=Erythrobacter sp. KY5 TaxID=2011159 RepID=UPI001F3E10BF|nr:chemotaxis-specific protein-glutamate methyltransferase CheB [Erythrobacter sp. KY5]
MIVDDSLTVRTVLKRIVESDGAMEVTATASSGERAIAQLGTTDADVLLLDLEMPGMGGLEALPAILAAAPDLQVLVVSSLTDDGAEATVQALSTGAADTMLKPRPGGFNEDYRSQLLGKIRALGGKGDNAAASANAQISAQEAKPARLSRPAQLPELVAIGASTGGIHALNLMLRELTPDFDLPILITQHLPSSFIPVFARQVEVASGRPTHIADDGTEIRKGEIAIATGHGHMIVKRLGETLVARISSEPARSGCLPSVDPMLRSAADACNGRVHAIILSGMGRDGFDGVQHLRESGGTVWTQDAETSAVWGMPGAVTKAGFSDYVAAPPALGQALMAQIGTISGTAQPTRQSVTT